MSLSFPGGGCGQNVLIFRVELSFSAHIAFYRINNAIKFPKREFFELYFKNLKQDLKLLMLTVIVCYPVCYPFSIKTSKCSGNCNNINHPYAKICVPDFVKDLNVKVFNLMSRTNEKRHIKWHIKCKCICMLNATVCNNKKLWNSDKR